jgi:ABC-type lipoprotein release transport system permease subunit
VLRAIGTSPNDIFQLIMLESGMLALISCALGTLFALPCILYLQNIGITLPEPINMGGIAFQTLFGELNLFSATTPFIVVLASTLLVSLYPALRAAKISPLKAMQAL